MLEPPEVLTRQFISSMLTPYFLAHSDTGAALSAHLIAAPSGTSR